MVAAGLDSPNGTNPQIVKNGDSYSLLTNRKSLNNANEIVYNRITITKTHSENIKETDIPAGVLLNEPIEGTDADQNRCD